MLTPFCKIPVSLPWPMPIYSRNVFHQVRFVLDFSIFIILFVLLFKKKLFKFIFDLKLLIYFISLIIFIITRCAILCHKFPPLLINFFFVQSTVIHEVKYSKLWDLAWIADILMVNNFERILRYRVYVNTYMHTHIHAIHVYIHTHIHTIHVIDTCIHTCNMYMSYANAIKFSKSDFLNFSIKFLRFYSKAKLE